MPGAWVALVLASAVGFFVGGISPASIVARLRHGDLRLGSGNPGATHTGRLLGVRWGVLVGVLDVLKGLAPTLLALLWFGRVTAYAVGLACILGHILSPYLKGRGGKGVATALGAVIAVLPWFALVMVAVFGVVAGATRWVAGASISAALTLVALSAFAPLPPPVPAGRFWGCAVGLIVIARHHRNIRVWMATRLR